MTTRMLGALVASALLVGTAGCAARSDSSADSAGNGSTDPVTFGASLALTGASQVEGSYTKEGYELCKQVVNGKGGISVGGAKRQLEITYADDTSQPDVSAQLVEKFNDQGIKLILGPYGSAATEPVTGVVERTGQVMVVSAGADDKIFAKGYQRSFAVLSPATSYVAAIVQAVADLAQPRPATIAFVSANDGFSKTATAAGVAKAKELGFTVVATEEVPSQTTDVAAALTKVKTLHPDLIIGSAHVKEGIALVKQGKELGVTPLAFAETVAPPTPDFVENLGPDAEGVLGSTQWTDRTAGKDDYFGTAADYAKSFAAAVPSHAVTYQNAQASAACLALALAVEKAGSTEPDAVRTALAGLDADSFFGRIKFEPSGMNLSRSMGVIQIQNGKAVSVWPKETATAPLIWPGNQA